MTTSCTPCRRQKSAKAAMPVASLSKALERSRWRHMGVQPALRNIHSTDDLVHGNLPCACDWRPTTVRSCVTVAKIPGSPTVVAGGLTGDIAKRRGRWPSASTLSRFHRTKHVPCRYKGWGEGQTRDTICIVSPSPGVRHPSMPSIRPTEPRDIAAITRIYAHAVEHGTASFELEPPDEAEVTRRYHALRNGRFPYLVAEIDGAVAGYAYAGPYRRRGRPIASPSRIRSTSIRRCTDAASAGRCSSGC